MYKYMRVIPARERPSRGIHVQNKHLLNMETVSKQKQKLDSGASLLELQLYILFMICVGLDACLGL